MSIFSIDAFCLTRGEDFHFGFRKEGFEMPKYIDLTVPFDGKFRFKIDFKKDLTSEKDGIQATSYTISAHAFTHLDAPLHFVANGRSIDSFPVDYFIGEAAILDIPKGKSEPISAEEMQKAGKHAKNGDIVLIRTGWLEKMWGKEEFTDSPYLTEEAAEWLVRLKARIAGYDFVEDYIVRELTRKGHARAEDFVVHQKLLRNGVLNLEFVNNLSKISNPRVKVIALPILLKDCDGAPARVVAIED
jgi:kynurenine formamidase